MYELSGEVQIPIGAIIVSSYSVHRRAVIEDRTGGNFPMTGVLSAHDAECFKIKLDVQRTKAHNRIKIVTF